MKKYFIWTLIVVFTVVLWIGIEKSDSYSEPTEAILVEESDLTLIPCYKINHDALYFFIKDINNLGAVYLKKGLFRWKAGMLTWGPIDSKRNYETLNGYKKHGDKLIYGLIKHGENKSVEVNGNPATMLDLAILPQDEIKKLKLEDIFVFMKVMNL